MLLARFLKDRRASVAPMLALSAIPILGAVSAAVDYSRANLARTAMQSALDATALILSKDAQTMPQGELDSKATAIFLANFNQAGVVDPKVKPVLSSPAQGSFLLSLEGSAKVNATFTRIFGHNEIDLKATSEVLWGIKKLNLAMALDVTGSMASSGKMTALKEAAHNLINTLKQAESTPGDVKISIVPFAVDVNVGPDNVDKSWIDWSEWETKNGTCSVSWAKSQSSCTSWSGTWTPSAHDVWNGCVMDRDQNNDVLNTATGTTAATKYRAHQASACPAAMLPLSNDWTALHDKVDALNPTGNTNVTIGLQLAWQTLTAAEPFNAPAAAADLDKVIILLTDGQNTQNRWTSSGTSIDARTEKACENIKADNVKVYTVRVIAGNISLLKNCATKPDMYYDVQEADQLSNVFSSIAQNLANLRIAK
jgi:Flp pilus assembly protein TadG